jgi:hypothetical protein
MVIFSGLPGRTAVGPYSDDPTRSPAGPRPAILDLPECAPSGNQAFSKAALEDANGGHSQWVRH